MGNQQTGLAAPSHIEFTSFFLPDADSTEVCVQHAHLTGNRIITIGEQEVVNETKKLDFGSEHNLTYKNMKLLVKITTTKSSFAYYCSCDGKEVLKRPSSFDEETRKYRLSKKLEQVSEWS